MAAAKRAETDTNLLGRALYDAQVHIAKAAERFWHSYSELQRRIAEQHALSEARYGPELNEPIDQLLKRTFKEGLKTASERVDALRRDAIGLDYAAEVIQKVQNRMDLDVRALHDAERAAAAAAALPPVPLRQRSARRQVWNPADLAPLDIDELAHNIEELRLGRIHELPPGRFDTEPVESPIGEPRD